VEVVETLIGCEQSGEITHRATLILNRFDFANSLPSLLERSSMCVVMRAYTLILVLLLASGSNMCNHTKPGAPAPVASAVSTHKPLPTTSPLAAPAKVDFAAQVRPILESRCTPCHFAGGTMYKRLPFDRQETIKTLGTKLFSRIKEEEERRVIREFLAQQ
jgi:hypothetical protein